MFDVMRDLLQCLVKNLQFCRQSRFFGNGKFTLGTSLISDLSGAYLPPKVAFLVIGSKFIGRARINGDATEARHSGFSCASNRKSTWGPKNGRIPKAAHSAHQI